MVLLTNHGQLGWALASPCVRPTNILPRPVSWTMPFYFKFTLSYRALVHTMVPCQGDRHFGDRSSETIARQTSEFGVDRVVSVMSGTGTADNTVGNGAGTGTTGTGLGSGTTGTVGSGMTGTGVGSGTTETNMGGAHPVVTNSNLSSTPILGGEGVKAAGHTGTGTGHTGTGHTGTGTHTGMGGSGTEGAKGSQYDATGGQVDDRSMMQKGMDAIKPGSQVGQHGKK